MQCSDLFFKRSLTSVVSILEEKLVQQHSPGWRIYLEPHISGVRGVSTLVKDKFCTCFGGMCK